MCKYLVKNIALGVCGTMWLDVMSEGRRLGWRSEKDHIRQGL